MGPQARHHAIERNIDRRAGWHLADCTCGWGIKTARHEERDEAIELHATEATNALPCAYCGRVGDMAEPVTVERSGGWSTHVWVCRSCGRVAVESNV